jgi:hypothetical protein
MRKSLILLLFAAIACSKGQTTTSKIYVQVDHFDFGKVVAGQIVKHDYEIQNTGNADLIIKNVSASCGCTAATPEKTTLKPGEKGNVRIDLDTSKREGNLTRTVTLFSNDPSEPNRTITLLVNITKKKS